MDKFSDELRFILITSEASVLKLEEQGIQTSISGLSVEVTKTAHKKCVRCWHSRSEVGSIEGHESICHRCYENVEGEGETRNYA